jgi:hypothetical protein
LEVSGPCEKRENQLSPSRKVEEGKPVQKYSRTIAMIPCNQFVAYPITVVRFHNAANGTVGCFCVRSSQSWWKTQATSPITPAMMVAITKADFQGWEAPPETSPRMRTEMEGMKRKLPILRENGRGQYAFSDWNA